MNDICLGGGNQALKTLINLMLPSGPIKVLPVPHGPLFHAFISYLLSLYHGQDTVGSGDTTVSKTKAIPLWTSRL